MSEHTREPWLAEFEELVHGTYSMRCEAADRYAKLRAEREELERRVGTYERAWLAEHGRACKLMDEVTKLRAALAEKGE